MRPPWIKSWLVGIFMGASLSFLLTTTAQADQGQDLFKKKMCFACHGPGKKGGDLAASKMDKAAMIKFLKDPKAVKPQSGMPAFKGADEELNALVDYVLTLKK